MSSWMSSRIANIGPVLLIKQMVRAGLLGRKSGKGFYEWGSASSTKASPGK